MLLAELAAPDARRAVVFDAVAALDVGPLDGPEEQDAPRLGPDDFPEPVEPAVPDARRAPVVDELAELHEARPRDGIPGEPEQQNAPGREPDDFPGREPAPPSALARWGAAPADALATPGGALPHRGASRREPCKAWPTAEPLLQPPARPGLPLRIARGS